MSVRGRSDSVLVQGEAMMNRAVDGDVVALQLLPESEWRPASGKLHTTAKSMKAGVT